LFSTWLESESRGLGWPDRRHLPRRSCIQTRAVGCRQGACREHPLRLLFPREPWNLAPDWAEVEVGEYRLRHRPMGTYTEGSEAWQRDGERDARGSERDSDWGRKESNVGGGRGIRGVRICRFDGSDVSTDGLMSSRASNFLRQIAPTLCHPFLALHALLSLLQRRVDFSVGTRYQCDPRFVVRISASNGKNRVHLGSNGHHVHHSLCRVCCIRPPCAEFSNLTRHACGTLEDDLNLILLCVHRNEEKKCSPHGTISSDCFINLWSTSGQECTHLSDMSHHPR
jgi:hypothetical protein